MTKELFDKTYKEKGGIYTLASMRVSFESLKSISEHFGVSRERVRQWMVELFGEKYDPRQGRRTKMVKAIMASLMSNGEEETKKIYKNGYYLRLAKKRLQRNDSL